MRIYALIVPLIALCGGCIATIIWGLNPEIVAELEQKFDLSDAVLSAVILLLLIAIPTKFEENR